MSGQTAKRLRETYKPENREHFEAMCKVLANAETGAQLDKIVLLYIFDVSYARADISAAYSYVVKLKGWG